MVNKDEPKRMNPKKGCTWGTIIYLSPARGYG